jgi:hypothetical protein
VASGARLSGLRRCALANRYGSLAEAHRRRYGLSHSLSRRTRGDLSRDSFDRFEGTPIEKLVSNAPPVFNESISPIARQRTAAFEFMIEPIPAPGR